MALPGWNDTFTDHDPIDSAEFMNMFVDACNERFYARGGAGSLAAFVNGRGNGNAADLGNVLQMQGLVDLLDDTGLRWFVKDEGYDGMTPDATVPENMYRTLYWTASALKTYALGRDWLRYYPRR